MLFGSRGELSYILHTLLQCSTALCQFPTQRISCVGDHYDLALPKIGDFDPNQLTMQQLCVKPEYGGNPQHSLNGWCQVPRRPVTLPPRLGTLAFDSMNLAEPLTLRQPRIMLGCMYRCFCSYGLQDPSIQPYGAHYFFNQLNQPFPTKYTYEVQIDVVDDFDVPGNQHMVKDVGSVIHPLPIRIGNQAVMNIHEDVIPYTISASMDTNNDIKCRGALPRFPLPAPYLMSEFDDLTELCAVQWSGGKA